MWQGRLTALDMTPFGWLVRKTLTQTNRWEQCRPSLTDEFALYDKNRCYTSRYYGVQWFWRLLAKSLTELQDAFSDLIITKTRLYSFDPLKPHFYIVKLGFTGLYIIFLISDQNIDCGSSLEPPRRGGSNEDPQSMFWAEIRKISEIFIWKVSFFVGKIFSIFE